MKKVLVSALAIASMVACSTDEVVEQWSPAISFDQVFVENSIRGNSTRVAEDPSTTTDSFNALTGFDVWAFIDEPSGVVFDGEDVTGSKKTGWSYTNLQYWTPGHDYYFSALAPMNSENWSLQTGPGISSTTGAGMLNFKNIDGSEDLLYAHTVVNTKDMTVGQQMDPVKFTFDHLLSKVKFTFKNGMTNDNAYVVVSNVTMKAPAAGSINLADDSTWNDLAGELTLEFGNAAKMFRGVKEEADKERLTIPTPADYVYTIDFDIELFYGKVSAYKVHKTSTVTGFALEQGKAYNFTATIDAENLELTPIEFEVEVVKDWVTAGTPDEQVQEAELQATAQLGGEVTLAGDIELTCPLNVTSCMVLDLNGKTLTGSVNVAEGASLIVENGTIINTDNSVSGILSNGDLTLNNVNVESARHALRIESGNVVINGGTYKVAPTAKYTVYALNIGDTGTKANVVIKNGTFIGPKGTMADSGSAVAVKAGSSVAIEGGNYSGGLTKTIAGAGAITISGGTFDQNPSAWVATGYSVVENGNLFEVGLPVANLNDFVTAINNTAAVNVESAINNGTNAFAISNNDVVINMDGQKITAGGQSTKNYGFHVYGSDVVVNEANIDGAGFAVMDGSTVTVNSGTIAAKTTGTSRYIFYITGNSSVTINDGNYSFNHTSNYFVYADDGCTCYVNGGNFTKPLSNSASKDAFARTAGTGTVIITGGTFNVDPSTWVAEGYEAVKNGKIWTVSKK